MDLQDTSTSEFLYGEDFIEDSNGTSSAVTASNSEPISRRSSLYNYSQEEFDSLSLSQSQHSFTRFSRHFSGSEFSVELKGENVKTSDDDDDDDDDDDKESDNTLRSDNNNTENNNSRISDDYDDSLNDSYYSGNQNDKDSQLRNTESSNEEHYARNKIYKLHTKNKDASSNLRLLTDQDDVIVEDNINNNTESHKSIGRSSSKTTVEVDNIERNSECRSKSAEKSHSLSGRHKRAVIQLNRDGQRIKTDKNYGENYVERVYDDYSEDFESYSPDGTSQRSEWSELSVQGVEERLGDQVLVNNNSMEDGILMRSLPDSDSNQRAGLGYFLHKKLNTVRCNQKSTQNARHKLSEENKHFSLVTERKDKEGDDLRYNSEMRDFCNKKRNLLKSNNTNSKDSTLDGDWSVIHPTRSSGCDVIPSEMLIRAKRNSTLSRIEQADYHDPRFCSNCRPMLEVAALHDFTSLKRSVLLEKSANDQELQSIHQDGITMFGEILGHMTSLQRDPDLVFDLLLRPLHHQVSGPSTEY